MTKSQRTATQQEVAKVNKAISSRGFESNSTKSVANSSKGLVINRGGNLNPVTVDHTKVELEPEFVTGPDGKVYKSYGVKGEESVDTLVRLSKHFEEISTTKGMDRGQIEMAVGRLGSKLKVSIRNAEGNKDEAIRIKYNNWVQLPAGKIPTTLFHCLNSKTVEFVMEGRSHMYTAYEAVDFLEYMVEVQACETGREEEVPRPGINIAEEFFQRYTFKGEQTLKDEIERKNEEGKKTREFIKALEEQIRAEQEAEEIKEVEEELKLQNLLLGNLEKIKKDIISGMALRKIKDKKEEAKELLSKMKKEGENKAIQDYICVKAYLVGKSDQEIEHWIQLGNLNRQELKGKKDSLEKAVENSKGYIEY